MKTKGILKALEDLRIESEFFYLRNLTGSYDIYERVTIPRKILVEKYYTTPDKNVAKDYVKGLNEA